MGAVESVLREVEKATIRPLGEVARGVEKVTIRPLGEVARGVEKVTIRPLGEVARGVEKVTIRPLGEIARELEKLTIRPLGQVARGVEKVAIRPLGEIARDLEKLLVRPIGGIASKTLLLMGRVIDVAEQGLSMESSKDIQARKEILNEMAADAVQLEGEINEAIAATPPAEEDNLRFLGETYNVVANEIRGSIVHLQNNTELIQNNVELIRNNEELIHGQEELMIENQDLRDRLSHVEAILRNSFVNENHSDQLNFANSNDANDHAISVNFA